MNRAAALGAYVTANWERPFAYSDWDCAQFAAGWVEVLTGENPAAQFRGRYGDTGGGLALLRSRGFDSPLAYAKAQYGRVPTGAAQVGDLAVVNTPGGPAFGVVQGYRIYVVGEAGMMTMDLSAARLVFRV